MLSERTELPSKRMELRQRQASATPWRLDVHTSSGMHTSISEVSSRREPWPDAVIDWTANARQFAPPPASTSRWVPEFLGVERSEKEDLAKLTGLKLKIPKKPPASRSI
jgi:hypothetical protein